MKLLGQQQEHAAQRWWGVVLLAHLAKQAMYSTHVVHAMPKLQVPLT